MKEETIEGWVKVYETFDFMESELVEARLQDESIEFQVMNKADIGYTLDVGNNAMGRQALGLPVKFYVKPEDKEQAFEIINEDRSQLLDNPDINFEDTDLKIDDIESTDEEEEV